MPDASPADPRLDTLRAWLIATLATPAFALTPASSDASFRRYFRVSPGASSEPSLIAMDAPPEHEDCRPFVHVAGLLADAGVHAPRIVASDLERGFLLMTDLGDRTYADALDDATADWLYRDALDALVRWQRATREGALPAYDDALLRRELALFPDWYLARHLCVVPTAAERETLAATFDLLVANNLAQPCVYVHRDYHSRNLMHCTPNPGVLDFQDAVIGPITYDLVSLLRDAYVTWPEARELDWAIRYWERARAAGLPVDGDFAAFYRDYEWMGMQRQLKVLGIFARLCHRDGKDRYVADMPRVSGYLRRAASRYREFDPLRRALDAFDARAELR
ncbi:MAG TPA: phosphotransferase [Casimicrobiaceae bacterium]|jgi:aminoglycoside/choline kinase family phosphotransferase